MIFALFFWNKFFWSFSYHYCLRSFNVMTLRWRRLSRASINLLLIWLQKSSINVQCSCFINRFLMMIYKWDKWKWMSWICVSFFKIFNDVIRKSFETMRKAIFCIFINWVVVTLMLLNRSCDAYHIELS